MADKSTYEELEQRIRQLEQSEYERKGDEQALQESGKKYLNQTTILETILDAIPDVLGIQDLEHRIIRYNKAGYDFLNSGPDEVAGKKCFSLIGRDKPCEICATSEVYRTEQPARVEKYIPEMSVWLDVRAYPVFDENGYMIKIIEHLRDITRRKETEEELATKASMETIISDASQRFLTLTELDKSINLCLADIGRFCSAGRAYLFQFTSDGATMNNTHEWCAPGVKPEIENLQDLPLVKFPWWMKLLESGGNIHVKNVADLPPEAWAEKELLEAQNIKSVLVVPFLVENKLAGFMGFDNVASTRAWSKKELIPLRTLAEIIGTAVTRRRADEALRKSEKKYRDVIENIQDVYYRSDRDGNLIMLSPSGAVMFGYDSVDEMLGNPIAAFFYHNLDDRNTFLAALSKTGVVRDYEEILHKKDGTPISVSVTSQYYYDDDGTFAGVEGIIRDLTERKRAEEEREKLQAQLNQAQKMESIGTLAGGIAHNFNNILMGIQGRASMMMLDKNPSDPDYEHVKGIEEYVKNAVELTRNLLGFARGGKYEVKTTDLNALIKNENMMFGSTKREIRIHGKYEKDLWSVEVDRSQIQQALLNLYVNAWQAMPGGGNLYIQTENITLDKQNIKSFEIAPGRYVKLSVTDTGVGMDDATREKLFDPFFSTGDIGQSSGLGLASVYGIIKNHGGFINVYSEKGAGATFNIYLPASEKEAEEEGTGMNRHGIQFGQETILLVDDEDMVIEVDQRMLEKLGYRVLTARSGQEALDLYDKQKDEIDLVILDMIMPVMGGGETFDRMKEMGGDAIVLLSSGYSIDEQAKEILSRGCIGFIQKPFSMKDLSIKLREALDEGKSNTQQ